MNRQETEGLAQLNRLVSSLQQENEMYRKDLTELVLNLSNKIDREYKPITLEQDILKEAQKAVSSAIQSTLTGYQSPMTKLVVDVVNEHHAEVKTLITEAFETVIRKSEFKQAVVSAFSHKVARSVISNNDGVFDKVANDLKQDAVFKGKMTLAVATIVEEVLQERGTR